MPLHLIINDCGNSIIVIESAYIIVMVLKRVLRCGKGKPINRHRKNNNNNKNTKMKIARVNKKTMGENWENNCDTSSNPMES